MNCQMVRSSRAEELPEPEPEPELELPSPREEG